MSNVPALVCLQLYAIKYTESDSLSFSLCVFLVCMFCAVALISIAAGTAVTEPSSDDNVTAAILTLSTDSGGALEVEVVVEVSATDGTASEFNGTFPVVNSLSCVHTSQLVEVISARQLRSWSLLLLVLLMVLELMFQCWS